MAGSSETIDALTRSLAHSLPKCHSLSLSQVSAAKNSPKMLYKMMMVVVVVKEEQQQQ